MNHWVWTNINLWLWTGKHYDFFSLAIILCLAPGIRGTPAVGWPSAYPATAGVAERLAVDHYEPFLNEWLWIIMKPLWTIMKPLSTTMKPLSTIMQPLWNHYEHLWTILKPLWSIINHYETIINHYETIMKPFEPLWTSDSHITF